MDALLSIHDLSNQVQHPSPADFDNYLPWACLQLEVDCKIVINRTVLKDYNMSVSSTASERLKIKRSKSSRVPSTSSMIVVSAVKDVAMLENVMHEKTIFVDTIYDSNLRLLRIKFLKNIKIPREVMKLIGLIIPFHRHLNSITINSGLHMDALYEISKFLPLTHITEMCLDGTFFIEANYHILLGQNSLKHLSLARCGINDTVLQTITSKLVYPCPASKTLCALNLATNRLTDTGMKYLGEMLRSNRRLIYLNVANNMITDDGAFSIFHSLVKFSLTDTEVAEVRNRKTVYITIINNLIQTIMKGIRTVELDKKPAKKKIGTPIGLNMQSKKLIDTRFIDITRIPSNASSLYETAKTLAENKMGPLNDPFGSNYVEKRGDITYCYGNNTLCYLNLAYNNLTYKSVKKLYEVLLTQNILNRNPKGLINVVIEGNFLPVNCAEFEGIDALLTSGLSAYNAVSQILKKKVSRSKTSSKSSQVSQVL